jgi:hypothetical protein
MIGLRYVVVALLAGALPVLHAASASEGTALFDVGDTGALPSAVCRAVPSLAAGYRGNDSRWGSSLGGISFSLMRPSSSAFSGASGVGIGIRGFGDTNTRSARPDPEYVWAVYAEGLRYRDEATGSDHDVAALMFALGIELIPAADIYLRVGLGPVSHDDPTGGDARGIMADLTLGWMAPIGSIDIAIEGRQIWAKPGDVDLDATGVSLGIYYLW